MAHRVCPWWLGYLLASPLRRLWHDPVKVLAPYVREGMTVLEPGPGMGFFTLELGRMVGPTGRVVAVDIQPRMLSRLKRRAARAGVLARVNARSTAPDTLGVADLAGAVDFTLAFFLVHELPAVEQFFSEVARASKQGAGLLFTEPAGHVKEADFEVELEAAIHAGFELVERPALRGSHAAFLKRT
jgi:ubiquinone/menaquinone biosynthesis C-methylase UbiE